MSCVCIVLLLAHVVGVVRLPAIERLEDYLYDVRLRLAMPGGHDPRVVIVDIDEKSLAALGHWPWQRSKLAALMDSLFDRYHIRAAGFDVVFAEPDESTGLPVLKQLAQTTFKGNAEFSAELAKLAPKLDNDHLFGAALTKRGVVTGFYYSNEAGAVSSGQLPPPILGASALAAVANDLTSGQHYGANLPVLQDATPHGGHFVPVVDADGETRHVPLVARIGDAYYPALSLALARLALGDPPFRPLLAEAGQPVLEGFMLGDRQLPTDPHGWALVPYRGSERSFPYVSVIDVLDGKVPADVLRDRIVLLGTTAPGLKDLRVTPVGEAYPGVEVHANMIAGILDGNLPQKPGYLLGAEFLLLLFIGPLVIWVLLTRAPLVATSICAVVIALLAFGNVWLWQHARLDLPFANALLLVAMLYVLNMAYGYFFVSRRSRQFTKLFGQYVVPALVQKMSEDPEKYTMVGQSRQLTALFTDVRSFTKISEGLPADQLANYMNTFLTEISSVISHKRLGTIDKYMGDCVMAFWGAPVYDPDHATNAVLAAMEIQVAIAALNPKLVAANWPPISVGVGVNTGHMTVGDMGSQFRMAYTVMGDAVNLASRLEGQTKYYGVGVLVGEETHDATRGIIYREIDRIRVIGRHEAVAIYEPLGVTPDAAAEKSAVLFGEVLRLYRAREWDLAELQLLNLQRAAPDSKLFKVYLERIAGFRKNPPPDDWDGVHVAESK